MKFPRSLLLSLAASALTSLGMVVLPAQAQSETQVATLVEALRLSAPNTGTSGSADGLYSDWQVKPDTIVSWSGFCKQPTTPEEFAANAALARSILNCVVADLLKEEYAASGGDINVAVKRSASWWMTGDSSRYTTDSTIDAYAQKVLEFYTFLQSQPRG